MLIDVYTYLGMYHHLMTEPQISIDLHQQFLDMYVVIKSKNISEYVCYTLILWLQSCIIVTREVFSNPNKLFGDIREGTV